MSKDQWINLSLLVSIAAYISILIIGLVNQKLSYLTAMLNLITALSILFYWIQKEIRIQQHMTELREIVVLCFEVIVIGCVVYSLATKQWSHWIRIVHYVVFGIHLLALLLFLIFMLTFKMKRLI